MLVEAARLIARSLFEVAFLEAVSSSSNFFMLLKQFFSSVSADGSSFVRICYISSNN